MLTLPRPRGQWRRACRRARPYVFAPPNGVSSALMKTLAMELVAAWRARQRDLPRCGRGATGWSVSVGRNEKPPRAACRRPRCARFNAEGTSLRTLGHGTTTWPYI